MIRGSGCGQFRDGNEVRRSNKKVPIVVDYSENNVSNYDAAQQQGLCILKRKQDIRAEGEISTSLLSLMGCRR